MQVAFNPDRNRSVKQLLLTIFAVFLFFPVTSKAFTCAELDGSYVYSQEYDPVYLGFFGSQYASESIMNAYGTYGSEYNSLSVRNPYGTYGSEYNTFSATNPYTNTPPALYKYGVHIGYLTANPYIANGISLGTIDASCSFYSSTPAAETNPVDPPEPPSQVEASDGTDSEIIQVNWSAVSDATSYNLYYSENVDSALAFVGAYTVRSVNITGAEPGKTYYFWVYSVNAAGESYTGTYDTGYVAESSSETVPEPPTITGTEVGDSQVTFKFKSNGDGGSPISGYTAQCGSRSSSGTSSPITIGGLQNGSSYTCSVTATNAVGDSEPSASVTVTPQEQSTPFSINSGLNDSWFNPTTDGQGVLISVFPNVGSVFAAWFTFDSVLPDDGATAEIGGPGQRWLIGYGEFAGNTVMMDLLESTGGIFNRTTPAPTASTVGTMEITWHDCSSATMNYSIETDSGELTGSIDLVRVSNDNVELCEALSE